MSRDAHTGTCPEYPGMRPGRGISADSSSCGESVALVAVLGVADRAARPADSFAIDARRAALPKDTSRLCSSRIAGTNPVYPVT